MAGGTWTSQNKVQPGVYINTKSRGDLSVSIGEKGTAAIAEPLSWGPCGIVQEIIPGEDLRPYIGYDIRGVFLANLFRFKRLAVRNKEICHAAGVFRVRWATT